MEFQELQNRAEELLAKSAPTGEELAELDSLTEQITKAGNDLAAANETNIKKTALANALAVTKGLSDSVPQANRPVYAQSSETSRTTHKAEVMSGLRIRRTDFTVKEISEETYASLKADGYSDNVIGLATTDQFAKEFIAYAKKNPGKLSYGSAGNGSAGHLAFEYLKMTAEIFMLHVPYRGTGPMMTDLLSGRLDAASVGAAALLPFIKSGKVRCIATGSTQRLPQLPDVATVAEQGFPGFEMTQWYGMLAPASLPKEHLDKLAAETMKAVKAPEALKRLNGDAAEAIGGTPAQFAQFIAAEQARWQKVIKRAQIKPD